VELKDYIRDIPNYPIPGILFRDITPLLKNSAAFEVAIDRFVERYISEELDAISGIESRGFLFAAPLAYRLGKPLIPIRKEGKLPFETHRVTHPLEYGHGVLELHTDSVAKEQRVLIVDDLLATGGTAAATVRLVEQSGATVIGLAFVIELADLRGRDALVGYRIESLLTL
jgi:adenine phosphoribosyltransferase